MFLRLNIASREEHWLAQMAYQSLLCDAIYASKDVVGVAILHNVVLGIKSIHHPGLTKGVMDYRSRDDTK